MLSRTCELERPLAVALIPARGGSKGIPRKNLQAVNGVPLVSRAIATCGASALCSDVYVSTEDSEIAAVAAACDAKVIERPPALAGDRIASEEVLLHALHCLRGILRFGDQPQVLAWVQCTAPLLTSAEVDGTIQRLLDTEADVALAAVPWHGGLVRKGFAGRVRGVGWELTEQLRRRQDMGALYQIAGSVWAIRVVSFLRRGHVYSENTVIYPVPEMLDIDEPADLLRAETILRARETRRADQPQFYYPV